MSGGNDTNRPSGWHNETRVLSLMLTLRVNTGTLTTKKTAPKGGLLSRRCAGYQATLSAALLHRRYAMDPRPAKPRSIIAQVEGSGTAGTSE
jgi:hypothetical protein